MTGQITNSRVLGVIMRTQRGIVTLEAGVSFRLNPVLP
jgi:hypothetical protein